VQKRKIQTQTKIFCITGVRLFSSSAQVCFQDTADSKHWAATATLQRALVGGNLSSRVNNIDRFYGQTIYARALCA